MKEFCDHPVAALESGNLRVEYLTDVGPRLARLIFAGTNLLAELPDLSQDTEYGRFHFMGGHRLWHAPEALPRSYIPDQPVQVELLADGVRLAAGTEPGTGLAKSMEIRLDETRPMLTLRHTLRNEGQEDVECAPWALSMLRLGGTLILPQPGPTENSLLPNRWLALWPYSRIGDARLHLADDFILLDANASLPPLKLGTYCSAGWAAYWLDGILFVKRFSVEPIAAYPDGGCNLETYCNDRFVELETLGPLIKLQPGQSVTHTEIWELHKGLAVDLIPSSLRRALQRQ
ncbi:MAG: hypothetical protein WD751_00975 [Anaerolineales bacterium]